jgi:dual specificity phosphatase 12
LDDVEEADILQHLIPSITFIQAELDKGWGVLVHCQAGTSEYPRIYVTIFGLDMCIAGRSATVAAAYIMYSQNLDVSTAIDLIRKVRPNIKYVPFSPS